MTARGATGATGATGPRPRARISQPNRYRSPVTSVTVSKAAAVRTFTDHGCPITRRVERLLLWRKFVVNLRADRRIQQFIYSPSRLREL